jgi:Flp pilus assembly protein TadG
VPITNIRVLHDAKGVTLTDGLVALPPRRRWWRRDGRQRGAVIVEAAIVLPVLVVLLLGIIDFGWAFNDYISLRQGTREAARQAVVNTTPQPTSGSWSCNTTGLPAGVQAGATGANGDIYDLICYAKSRIGLSPDSSVRVSLYWDPGVAGTTPPYAANSNVTSIDSIVICTQYPLNSITGIFSPILNGTVITSKTEIRIEQTSANISTASPALQDPMQETPLPGSSWPASCQQQ